MRFLAATLSLATCLSSIACGSGGSYQQLSAGSVGCPPNEIRIRDVSSSMGGETWTARCRGLTYYCSKTEELFGHPAARKHDARCTVSSAPTSIPDPSPTRFSPGIASKRDGDHTQLRATLGAESLRAMFIGKPDCDPYRVQVIIARKSGGATFEGCRSLAYASGTQSGSLSADVKYARYAQDNALWETLTTTIARSQLGAVAAADSAELKACDDIIGLNQSQVVMLRAFMERWDEAAKRAPPGVTPPPEPDAAPASTPPIAEAAEPAPPSAAVRAGRRLPIRQPVQRRPHLRGRPLHRSALAVTAVVTMAAAVMAMPGWWPTW